MLEACCVECWRQRQRQRESPARPASDSSEAPEIKSESEQPKKKEKEKKEKKTKEQKAADKATGQILITLKLVLGAGSAAICNFLFVVLRWYYI